MGRKAGSKNFSNFPKEEPEKRIEITETEKADIAGIFTTINKDFIGIQDFIIATGLSYEVCARLVRQIKAVSDIFGISGLVHRTDYYMYVARQYLVQSVSANAQVGVSEIS